jgi:hypothetical protein
MRTAVIFSLGIAGTAVCFLLYCIYKRILVARLTADITTTTE